MRKQKGTSRTIITAEGDVPLLFIFVFGSAIPIPGGGSYKDYGLAGLLVLNLTTATSWLPPGWPWGGAPTRAWLRCSPDSVWPCCSPTP